MNEEIQNLMTALKITEAEAREMLEADKAIEQGADLFPLTAEQEQASKKARSTGTRTAYNFTKRERKADADKRYLINAMQTLLANPDTPIASSVTVENPERQIDFVYNDRHFRIVLSAPRAPN